MRVVILAFQIFFSCTIYSQSIAEKGQHRLRFGDSVWVNILAVIEPPALNVKGYYYLPTYLRLSENEEKLPEFMFMAFQRGEEQEAIMHWLLTWGITPKQQAVIDTFLIKNVDSTARLLGAVLVQADEKYTFVNRGGDAKLMQSLERSLTSGGIVPTHADAKSATSFKFSGEDAKQIIAALEDVKKCKGIYISMDFEYQIMSPLRNNINFSTKNRHTIELSLEEIILKARTCKDCIVNIK